MEPDNTKKHQIYDFLKKKQIQSCFTSEEIQQIENTTSLEFKSMIKEYSLKEYEKDLYNILFCPDTIPNNPQHVDVIKGPNVQISDQIFQKDILDYNDLKSAVQSFDKIKGSFSLKHIKRAELALHIMKFPKLRQIQNLNVSQTQIDLRSEVELLKNSLKKEGLFSQSSSIKQSFKKIENQKNPDIIFRQINHIKKQTVVIDIYQLSKLIQRNKSAGQKISKQSGIVFIGITGAGKSTTILSLLGHKMITKDWKKMKWVTPEQLLPIEGIQNLIANPSSKSVTRNVSAFALSQSLKPKKIGNNSAIYLVDTPGFKDTQGSIMDLSNSYGAASAIKSLKQARFVVLMSAKSQGNRNQGLKQITEILNKLFPNYQAIKQSVIYVFNRYSTEQIQGINAALQDVWKELSGSATSNQNLENIFNDLLQKTSVVQDILTFDPLLNDNENVKSLIASIMKKKASQNLGENFSVAYGGIVIKDIQKKSRILYDCCIHYFEQDQLEVCSFFISQLKQFLELLEENNAPVVIQANLQKIQKKIENYMNKQCSTTIQKFNKSIDNSYLDVKDVQQYQKEINKINKYQQYKQLKEYSAFQKSKKRLQDNIQDKMKQIVENIKKNPSNVNTKTVKALILLAEEFKKQKFLIDLESGLQKLKKKPLQSYTNYIKLSSYDESLPSYKEINSLQKIIYLLNPNKEKNSSDNLDQIILLHIQQKIKTIQPYIIDFSVCIEQNFKLITEISIQIQKLESSDFLKIAANSSKIQEQLKIFDKLIVQKAQQNLQNIQQYIGGKNNLSSQIEQRIMKIYKQRDHMKKIPHLKRIIMQKSIRIDRNVKKCLDNQKIVLSNFIQQIKNKKLNYNTLRRQVSKLDQAALRIQRVVQFHQDQETNLGQASDNIFELLDDYYNIVQEIRNNKLNLADPNILEQLKKLGLVLQILSAFRLDVAIKGRSKLLSKNELIDVFKNIKQVAQEIFIQNTKSASKILQNLSNKPKKADKQAHKFQNIKVKQIDSCLKFIGMGKKIFLHMPQRLKKFIQLETKLINKIKEWESQQTTQIKRIFSLLQKTKNEDLKNSVTILKKKIQTFKLIDTKYIEIKKILQSDDRNFIEQGLTFQITELYRKHEDFLRKYDKKQKSFAELSDFSYKCGVLSMLDCFCLQNNKFEFSKLESESQTKLDKSMTNTSQKLSNALLNKRYDQICKHLKFIEQKQPQIFSQTQTEFCILLKKQISKINNYKNRVLEADQMATIIDLTSQLTDAKLVIERNEFNKNSQVFKILTVIQKCISSFSQNIKNTFMTAVSQAQSNLNKNNFQQIQIEIKALQKIKKIVQGTQAMKFIDDRKIIQIKSKTSQRIQQFQNKYGVEKNDLDMSQLKEDYDTLFGQNVLNISEFIDLKRKITKKINKTIENKIQYIEKSQCFNKDNLNQIKDFLNSLPQQFREKSNYQKLEKQATKKFQDWQQHKKSINEQADKIDIFEGGFLNPRIIEFFKDGSAEPSKKKILLNKINQQLKEKFQRYQNLKLQDFLKKVQNLDEFKKPQQKQLKKNENIQEILDTYQQIYYFLRNKVLELFQNQINQLEKHLITPNSSISADECEKYHSNFISNFIQFSNSMNDKTFIPLQQEDFKESIKARLNQLLQSIFKHWQKNSLLSQNMTVLNINEDPNKITQGIKTLKDLRIVEVFVDKSLKLLKQSRKSNILIQIMNNKLQQIQNKHVLSNIIQTIENDIFPKLNRLLRYSLLKDQMRLMDDFQIENQLRQIDNLIQYFSLAFNKLMKAIGRNDLQGKVAEVSDFKKKIDLQADQIRQQILGYCKYPIFNDDKMEQIRRKHIILSKYSQYYPKVKNIIGQFQNELRNRHNQFFNKSQNIIKQLANKTEKYDNQLKKLNQKNKKQNQSKKTQLQKQLNLKLSKLKAQFDTKIASKDLKPEQKQKIQNNYKTQVDTESNLHKQEIDNINKIKNIQITKNQKKSSQELEVKLGEIALMIEKMVMVQQNLDVSSDFKKRVDDLVIKINKAGKARWIKILAAQINKIGSTTSRIILTNYPQFKDSMEISFKKNIPSLTIEQVLQNLKKQNSFINNDFIKELNYKYDLCNNVYQKWIEDYNKDQSFKQKLILQLKKKQSSGDLSEANTKIVGQIFALWTILNSKDNQGVISYPYKPHIVQIVTILILLGLPKQSSKITNKFAEIKTGQGKSLILAVLSAYFGLKKYKVDCVCYSQHLSLRDKNTFNILFTTLGLQKEVTYCTFNYLVQSFINHKKISLRSYFNDIVRQKNSSNGIIGQLPLIGCNKFQDYIVEKKILLIDESDVFFIEDFYGNTYIPSSELRSDNIKKLMEFIWKNKDQEPTSLHKTILGSSQFQYVVKEFSKFEGILKNQIGQMINGVKNCVHDYVIIDNKIAYKDQDKYSTKLSYGYKTTFAYFYEYSRKSINELPSSVSSIDFSLCEISFAELPKMYENIIGVTGTLKNMSQSKKQIMKKQYKINQNYIIPSVYKKSQRQDAGYLIVPENKHYQEIVNNIKSQVAKRRPIMIFFDNYSQVSKFYESENFQPYKNQTVVLSQKHNQKQRNKRILRAMQYGKISLITKGFIRGTDFIIYQDKVIELGGAHLLVSFVLDQKSEEVQALGRVGRQGDPGSSIFIVTDVQLQNKLKLNAANLIKQDKIQIQQKIDQARQINMSNYHLSLAPIIQKCKIKHQETIQLFNDILNKQNQNVLQYILKLNSFLSLNVGKPVKTVIAVDATISMTQALKATNRSLVQAFQRIYTILKNNNAQYGFQISMIFYRNYNSHADKLIEYTPFEVGPKNLVKFVKKVKAEGGWGSEALEVVYDHCLNIEDLRQIIIIADQPANTKQQTINKREHLGQDYWSNYQKFKTPVDRDQLVLKLKQKQVLLQTLPITQQAKTYFEQISKQTSGKCELFRPESANSIAHLTNFVSLSILNQLGQNKGVGEMLVQSYKATYKA